MFPAEEDGGERRGCFQQRRMEERGEDVSSRGRWRREERMFPAESVPKENKYYAKEIFFN